MFLTGSTALGRLYDEATVSILELAILGAIFVGFLCLIMYIANHARSKDEE